jgi:hypothetical protein
MRLLENNEESHGNDYLILELDIRGLILVRAYQKFPEGKNFAFKEPVRNE